MVYSIIFLVAMFIIYNYSVFELIDTLLKEPKLKKLQRIPLGIVNTLIFTTFLMVFGSTSLGAYILISTMLFVEFDFFHNDKRTSSLFCMLACVIHVMVVRALCVAGFAILMNTTIYDIVNTPFLLVLSTGVTLMLLNIAVLFVIKLVPPKSVRIINQHGEQLWFMISWLSVFCVYFLINTNVYNTPNSHPSLLVNHIAAPIAMLIGTYIVLTFSIKMGKMLGYKEKTEELEYTIEKERQYRTTIDKDVFRVIEVNFSEGEILSGFEDYESKLGDIVHNYRKMLAFMINATVHDEDKEEFIKYSSPLTVVDEFNSGTTEINFDYRRLMPEGHYVWMHVLMALIEDEETDDVKGFVRIADIDEEKKQQLELQYKSERDLLTGLYNKGTTEMLISKYITSNKSNKSGVLFIVDIDNFKMINDRLGHLYGDAVLSELSESLSKIFRDCDIVGRIGGDEFLIFSEGSYNDVSITEKAHSICAAFLQTYSNEKNESCTVSSSIGIAVYPQDGKSFEELFKNADVALYTAKANGKNCYALYNKHLEMSFSPIRTEIDTHGLVQKSFKDNKIEYVFRLLYGSEDTQVAIESALELIANNFGFSRANIFEFNDRSTHFDGVFEWCSTGIDSVSDNYIGMPVTSFDFVISTLEKSGGMFSAVPTDFPEYAQSSYTSIGIKYIVHFSILEDSKLIGVIAFQHCIKDDFKLTDTEFEELRTICQILSVFMAKQLRNNRGLRHHQDLENVIDNMNSIAYVVDVETFEVYYENQNTIKISEKDSIATKCHQSYRGFDAPCSDCPFLHLSNENPKCTLELYTEKFNLYTITSASLIDWSNGRKSMLISSVDITEYK